MDKNKVIKVVLTLVGIGCSIGSTLVGSKQQKDTIKEEVAKALSKTKES